MSEILADAIDVGNHKPIKDIQTMKGRNKPFNQIIAEIRFELYGDVKT